MQGHYAWPTRRMSNVKSANNSKTCVSFYSRLVGNPIKELSGETFLHNTRLEAL